MGMLDTYKDKYVGSFHDIEKNDITISIKGSGYTGSVTSLILDANPITITASNSEMTNTINGIGCEINVKTSSTNPFEFNDLFATPERDNLIYVTRNSDVIFTGFVCPEIYRHNLLKTSSVVIPSNSILDAMSSYTPLLFSGSTDYLNLMDVVKDIIWNATGLYWDIYINNTIYTTFYDSTFRSGKTLFDYIYFYTGLYVKDDDIKDGKFILDSILRTFYSRLYLLGDKWIIDRIKDQEETTYKIYYYTPYFATGMTTITKTTYAIENNYTVNNSAVVTYNTGKGKYKMSLAQKQYPSLTDSDFRTYIEMYCWFLGYYIFSEPNKFQWFIPFGMKDIRTFSDSYIKRGVTFMRNGTDITYPDYDRITTRLDFQYWPGDYNLTIDYTHSLSYMSMDYVWSWQDADKFRGSCFLRYKTSDHTAIYGYKFIVPNAQNSGYTVTKVVTHLYSTELKGTEIKWNSLCIKPSFTINMKDVFDVIRTEEYGGSIPDGAILSFFLDINQWEQYHQNAWHVKDLPFQVGDIVTTVPVDANDNFIQGTIDKNYKNTIEATLDLFDSSGVSYMNSMYFMGIYYGNSLFNNSTMGLWRDKYGVIAPTSIQKLLLIDLVNQYNSHRRILDMDIRLKDKTKLINYDNVFTYSLMPGLKFIPTGFSYNVKFNVNRITLNEWKSDDGFFI